MSSERSIGEELRAVENWLVKRWETCSEDEASILVELMTVMPSPRWLDLLADSRQHPQMLLLHEEDIRASAALALADMDDYNL